MQTQTGINQQQNGELERLTDALSALFHDKALGEWFETPNRALGGLKPIEAIDRGETDRLWQMVFECGPGRTFEGVNRE